MALSRQKSKLNKLIQQTDSDDSEQELSFYVNDRVKLMKEVLKTIRPKKIKAMTPSCLKNKNMEEINSMLLEELLGISNKRIKYIFSGQNLDEESSSSTNEDEPIDIISLDDISDDEFVINIDDNTEPCNKKLKKVKKEHKNRKIKEKYTVKEETSHKTKEEYKKTEQQNTQIHNNAVIDSNENLMSVLELLELQARARAIKSQLLIENSKIQETISEEQTSLINHNIESDDDVIIENTKTEEIIITSSESEEDTKIQKIKKNIFEASIEISEQRHINDKGRTDILKVNDNTLHYNSNEESYTFYADNKNIANETSREVIADSSANTLRTSEVGGQSKSEEIRIKSIEYKRILEGEVNIYEIKGPSEKECATTSQKLIQEKKSESKAVFGKENQNKKRKQVDNDGTIVINLSDYEMEELK